MQCYHIICLRIGHLLLTDRIAQLVLSRRQFVDSKRDERQGGWQCSPLYCIDADEHPSRRLVLLVSSTYFPQLSRHLEATLRQQCIPTHPKGAQAGYWVGEDEAQLL